MSQIKHLTCFRLAAYFDPAQLNHLSTIDDIPSFGDVSVPEGWFKKTRGITRSNYFDLIPRSTREHTSVTSPSQYSHPTPKHPTPGIFRLAPPRDNNTSPDYPSPVTSNSPIIDKSAFPPTISPVPPSSYRFLAPIHHVGPRFYQPRDPIDEQYLRRFSACPFTFGDHRTSLSSRAPNVTPTS